MNRRQTVIIAIILFVVIPLGLLVLSDGCDGNNPPAPVPPSTTTTTSIAVTTTTTVAPTTTTTVPAGPKPTLAETLLWIQGVNRAKWEAAIVQRFEPQVVQTTAVRTCIHNHESWDPTEHSHLSDGSGWYQMIPRTFRTYAARLGITWYAFAYEAPAPVQDAIAAFMLTTDGAGNWSPRYGNDPCTVGMGG